MTTSVRREADMTADKVRFRGKGIAFSAAAGVTTSYDYKLTAARLLDGTRLILKDQANGDHVTLQVVDVDNILGYGTNVVLDEFATTWYVSADVSGQEGEHLPYSAEILANLYIRIIYVSTGATAVAVKCNLYLHAYSG